MREVNKVFARMPEKCDPYVYYHRVRPFIFGSKDNPDLKSGLVYEGEFKNKAQFFRGETGAQSSIIPALDAAASSAGIMLLCAPVSPLKNCALFLNSPS